MSEKKKQKSKDSSGSDTKSVSFSGTEITVILQLLIENKVSGGHRNVRDWLVGHFAPFREQVSVKLQEVAQEVVTGAKAIDPNISMQELSQKVQVKQHEVAQTYTCTIEMTQTQLDLTKELFEYIEKEQGFTYTDSITYNVIIEKLRAIL